MHWIMCGIFAYFVPANVRNGRLFAGLQANPPRYLPFLAGTSFRGYGIGPELFAAFRGRKLAQQQDRKRSILPSPLKAVLNLRIIAWSGIRTTDSPRARSPSKTTADVISFTAMRNIPMYGDRISSPNHYSNFTPLYPNLQEVRAVRALRWFMPTKQRSTGII